MTTSAIEWAIPPGENAQRRKLRLPFNGKLSREERLMLLQGFGNRGTDYDVWLYDDAHDQSIEEAA